MNPAAATPTAATSSSAASEVIMATTASSSFATSPAGVGTRSLRTIAPSSSTTAPAIFVPPMSIPIACTRGAAFQGRMRQRHARADGHASNH